MADETTDQAQEQSVTDRIAGKFGFPQQEETETAVAEVAAENAEPDLFEVDWEDGQKYRIPAPLKDAFLRQSDYTQKTQALADERRSVDHIRETAQQANIDRVFNESIAAENQELSVIEAYLQQAGKLDWSQMSTEQMLRHKVEMDTVRERKAQLEKATQGKRAKFDQDVKAKMTELRQKAREIATKSIPGFSEEAEKALRASAKSEGLNDSEIDSVLLDPRSYRILWKAAQFDKVQSGTQKAQAAANKAEKVLKPGASNPMPPETAAKLNFRKAMKSAHTSGDKARVIEDRLTGIFGG